MDVSLHEGSDEVFAFVDEYKSEITGRPNSPVCHGARILTKGECYTLFPVLDQVEPLSWRKRPHRMFGAPGCELVLATLMGLKSPFMMRNRVVSDCTSAKARDAFARQCSESKDEARELERREDVRSLSLSEQVGNGPYAIGFVDFICRLVSQVESVRRQAGISGMIHLRILSHNMDFFSKKLKRMAKDENGCRVFPLRGNGSLRVEIGYRYDSTPGIEGLAPFLELVDSELWAFGRFGRSILPSGELVHDRYLAWSRGLAVPPTETELREAFRNLRPSLRDYLMLWLSWTNTPRLQMI